MGRIAVYFLPEGRLGQLGGAWLGHDVRLGMVASTTRSSWVSRPQRYGFHATIKAPFYLRPNTDIEAVTAQLTALCACHAPLSLSMALDLTRPMAALRPRQAHTALWALACDIITGLDRFRAPLRAEDIARRTRQPLTPYQRAMLAAWGYPHVMDAFDFHLTLTAALPQAERPAAHAALRDHFGDVLDTEMRVDRLSLCREDDQGRFHWLCDAPLTQGIWPADTPAMAQR